MHGERRRHEEISSQDLEALAGLARQGNIAARNQIVEHNLPFARWMAKDANPGMREDLEQAAVEGLIFAAQRFDPSKGAFSTYGWYWSRQGMRKEKARMASLPAKTFESLSKSNPLHPSNSLHLDTLIPGQDRAWMDVIPDSASRDPEIEAVSTIDGMHVQAAVKTLLSHREQMVVSLRYGLGPSGARPHSLEEIGKRCGLSRERIRQIEASALKKLRQGWHAVPSPAKDYTWEGLRSNPDLLSMALRMTRPLDVARKAGIPLITLNKVVARHGIEPVPKPPKRALVDLYYKKKQSQQAISNMFNVREYDVRRWFRLDGLQPRTRKEALSSPKPALEEIRHWYENDHLTIDQIRAITKAGYPAVRQWLREAGCTIRTGKPPSPYDSLPYRRQAAQDLLSQLRITPYALRTHHFYKARQTNGKSYEGLLCWYRRKHIVRYAQAVELLRQELFGISQNPLSPPPWRT